MEVDMGEGLEFPSVKDKVSKEEWETRVDLAACFRMVSHFGYADSTGNHISARVPGEDDHFLINPGGYLFSEVSASSLVKVHIDGTVLSEAPTGYANEAGYVIHSAVMMARPDIRCCIHTHTIPSIAVSLQEDGLQYYCQESLRFYNKVGYHDYEGTAEDIDERQRLAADLGDNDVLFLRNHGLLVVGATIGETFIMNKSVEKSCNVQVTAQSSGVKLVQPPDEIYVKTANRNRTANGPRSGRTWAAFRRMADKLYLSHKN